MKGREVTLDSTAGYIHAHRLCVSSFLLYCIKCLDVLIDPILQASWSFKLHYHRYYATIVFIRRLLVIELVPLYQFSCCRRHNGQEVPADQLTRLPIKTDNFTS